MEYPCISDKCKKELKNLESDKVYKALNESINLTSKAMIALNFKSNLSKKDLSEVNILYNQMMAHIKAKSDIELFNQMRQCTFDKCRKDIDKTMAILINECQNKDKDISKNACKIIQNKMNDNKQVQKALDAVFIDIWTNWKKNMLKKIKAKN